MKKDQTVDYEYPEQKIVDIGMEKEISSSFIQYAMSVIVARALPDARDGMKPGQRRILYAMYEDHLTHDNAFRKSATTVGNVLGRYHPHGDAAVYGSLVRMAQPFSYRYPLIEGHGNFGTIDGDPAAAYRYTEARLSKISEEMMADLDKDVVIMDKNFDNTRDEPSVLPSRFPNLLVNGAVGIAVGMATNIPPHNLAEVIDGTIFRMDNPDCTPAQLMDFIKGPDFPTGGIIYGVNGILEAYTTGRGRVMVRARAEIKEDEHQIVVTEIPYMLYKSALVENIADLVKNKKIDGITDIRDLSNKNGGIKLVIDYSKNANGQIILNKLYKMSRMEDTCSVNMLAIVNGEPKVLPLAKILDIYISHQESVVRRRTQFNLNKAEARAHLLEGYLMALDHIDEIVEIMKKSDSVQTAKETLCRNYGFSDRQSQAIVEMTLGRLTGLERQKIINEYSSLTALIGEYKAILADENLVRKIVREELIAVKEKYADKRKTEIVPAEKEIIYEDLIERHTCVVTLTRDGYIKRIPADVYSAQRRGGKGIIGMQTKEDDIVDKVAAVDSHSYLLMFTSRGKVYSRKAYTIPEATRTSKGTYARNVIEIEAEEKITAMISVSDFSDENKSMVMVTKNGTIKRTSVGEFARINRAGKRALILRDDDELVYVGCVADDDELLIATSNGYGTRFRAGNVRIMGRNAAGVRGIRLRREGDNADARVVGVAEVEEGKELLTLTEKGLGKRTAFDLFTAHNRGGKGIRCHRITEKTGDVVAIASVAPDDELLVISDSGIIIRVRVSEISESGRSASGVRVMRTGEDYAVSSLAVLPAAEETAEEANEEDYTGEINDLDFSSGENEEEQREAFGEDEEIEIPPVNE
ncbi:MAG: DNA gyrase subunit A [Clostridia bacterium]|nr:DNA gyrase subunit A [Clostridia bacterium]